MIKLSRPDCPEELEKLKDELTQEYKDTKKTVWKRKFITVPLLKMSNDKCAFCECKLGEEGKYMQVEHFHHKNEYKDEVVDWNNLLPICIRCNSHKLDHDTYLLPIIDPTQIDPKNHLEFYKYRMLGKDDIGNLTVEVLDLNNTTEIATPRFQIGNAVLEKLEDVLEVVQNFDVDSKDATEKARVIRKVRALLKKSTSVNIYCATVATVLLTAPDYLLLKLEMEKKALWTVELQKIEDSVANIALDQRERF
ncbi:HNH endonuclease [Lysinibacillus sp. FSL M8-0216]|uniref:HNH endonuclease n=1 Tax=Lysinibacillus sp. FSL M8-0216 TaxID=2921619 RepID=UPI00315A08BA